jgi:hypothetical protein
MEILLLIAVIAAAAASLYVAANFNKRSQQNFAPLMDDASENIGKQIAAARGELEQQMTAIIKELRGNRELLRNLEATTGELREQVRAYGDERRDGRVLLRHLEAADVELRQQMQSITGEVRQNSEIIKRFGEQVGTRQNQLEGDLTQLDRRFAEFSDSLAHQGSRISSIYRYVIRQGTSGGSSAENDSLLLAMLEAESYVDDKGWGRQPHLYALAERGAQPNALVLLDQGRLPDGDLADVLAGIHWPADVAGCVLVTELAALPPRGEEDAPVDPVAAVDWTSTHPDGRAARLAVGVRRSGEHTCGLRIKGEDELQVRTDLAGNLVAALLRTF